MNVLIIYIFNSFANTIHIRTIIRGQTLVRDIIISCKESEAVFWFGIIHLLRTQIVRKTNIYAVNISNISYQGVRNVNFAENFANVNE